MSKAVSVSNHLLVLKFFEILPYSLRHGSLLMRLLTACKFYIVFSYCCIFCFLLYFASHNSLCLCCRI